MLTQLVFGTVAAIATYIGVAFFRRASVRKMWVDVPNERSSHDKPTPVGGGVIIVVVSLLAYVSGSVFFSQNYSKGYLLGALIIAIVSWFDDLYSLSFIWRLLAQLIAAFVLVSNCGYWTSFGFPALIDLTLPMAGQWITVVWIVWMINAYNFMDGIDGIAGIQGSVTAAAWALVSLAGWGSNDFYPVVLLGCCTGFLVHNWQPAKIFMGDVGSAFLGFTFASIPLLLRGSNEQPVVLPLVTVLFLWPFFFDSVLTLLRRLIKGEKVWQAHRSHLYQRLAIAGYSHSTISILYGVFAAFSAAVGLYVSLTPAAGVGWMLVALLLVSAIFAIIIFSGVRPQPLANENRR